MTENKRWDCKPDTVGDIKRYIENAKNEPMPEPLLIILGPLQYKKVLDSVIELENIKSKWWYKLFTWMGL